MEGEGWEGWVVEKGGVGVVDMEVESLTQVPGDGFVEGHRKILVLDHAGEVVAGFPALGGDAQGAGGREGAIKLFLEVQNIGVEEPGLLRDPEKLETRVAGQVDGQATELGGAGDVEVGHVGWKDVEDNVAGVDDACGCGVGWGGGAGGQWGHQAWSWKLLRW